MDEHGAVVGEAKTVVGLTGGPLMRRQHASLLARDVGDEQVLLDLESSRIHQLNRTASFIWQAFDGTKTVQDVAEALAKAFDVEQDVALADCVEVTGRLKSLGLLLEVEG